MLKGLLACGVMATILGLGSYRAEDDKPKYTIEEVMEKAHKKKTGIFDKVMAGKASKDDKTELVALYIEMAKNKPPKGEVSSWKKLNDALVASAKDVAAGKPGAEKKLKAAANCSDCHDKHKPD
jgi:hypothetical protein